MSQIRYLNNIFISEMGDTSLYRTLYQVPMVSTLESSTVALFPSLQHFGYMTAVTVCVTENRTGLGTRTEHEQSNHAEEI